MVDLKTKKVEEEKKRPTTFFLSLNGRNCMVVFSVDSYAKGPNARVHGQLVCKNMLSFDKFPDS